MTAIVLDTPEQIAIARLLTQYVAAKLFYNTGMGFHAFSNGGQIRSWAASYTGKTYSRSRKGMNAALNDIGALIGKEPIPYSLND